MPTERLTPDEMDVLTGACNSLDVVKNDDWKECWSTWDQDISDGLSEMLRAEYEARELAKAVSPSLESQPRGQSNVELEVALQEKKQELATAKDLNASLIRGAVVQSAELESVKAELATAKQEAEMWKAEYSAEVDKTDSTFERDTQRLAAQSRELERLRGAEGKLKRVLDHVREMHVEKCGCTICEMIGAALAPSEREKPQGKL